MVSEMRKARKEHVCDYCHLTIEKGERYRYLQVFPGEYGWDYLMTFKSHRFCHDICQNYSEYHKLCSDESPDFQDVLIELWEEWGLKTYLYAWDLVDQYKRAVIGDLDRLSHKSSKRQLKELECRMKNLQYRIDEAPKTFQFDEVS